MMKMIALTCGLLLLFGVAAFSTDGPAGPVTAPAVGGAVVYEIMVPIDLSDQELTDDHVRMLVILGILRPEGARQLGLVEGQRCHLVLSSCGPGCYYTWCRLGGGSVNCPCSWGVDPATE